MFAEVGYEYGEKTVSFINMKGDEKKDNKKKADKPEGTQWKQVNIFDPILFIVCYGIESLKNNKKWIICFV